MEIQADKDKPKKKKQRTQTEKANEKPVRTLQII